MKYLYKRIIAGLLAVVTLFFSGVPFVQVARADDFFETITSVPVDFWDWTISVINHDSNMFKSIFDKDICPQSTKSDGLHNFKEQRTTVDGKTGLYYICEYCGKSAGEVAEPAYDEYVSELPVTGYTSSGVLKFVVPVSYSDVSAYVSGKGTVYWGCVHDSEHSQSADFPCSVNVDENTHVYTFRPLSGKSILNNSWLNVDYYYDFVFPIDGFYRFGYGDSLGYCYDINGERVDVSLSSSLEDGIGSFHSAGDTDKRWFPRSIGVSRKFAYMSPPAEVFFLVTPEASLDLSYEGQYSITTRPTTITGGNYGIVGDDGTINTVTNNNQIVNETTNNYYNPATGQTSTITDWSYNYENRTYDITLDTGDKVSVEYGDQNIVIKEGDTVYNIYYMIDGSGDPSPSPDPGASACVHSWIETSRTDSTCTALGKVTYTCSQCGEIKTETIPALGHDWQVLRTVPTVYDEDGNQLQAGYTLYECSHCGEQYKDEGSTGPPGGNDGGLLEFLNGIIKHLSDNLSGAVELILRFFTEIPKLFSGFLDFLSAVFPYLPDDIIFLFTFGIAALVFVGIIKAIRR